MDKALKQRLVGATVLIILTVIILPMLLSGRSDTLKKESSQIEIPKKPAELSISKRRFPVGIPDEPTANVPASAPDTEPTTLVDEALAVIPEDGTESPVLTMPEAIVLEEGEVVTFPDDSNEDSQQLNADSDTTIVQSEGEVSVTTFPETAPAVATVIVPPNANVDIAVSEDNDSNSLRYLVQVASFSSEKRADLLAGELRDSGMTVKVDVVERTAGRLHRVRVGPYSELAQADAAIGRIKASNDNLSPRLVDLRPSDSAPVSTPSDPLVRWVVQVGSFASAESAESQVAMLRLSGLAAFSEKVTSSKGSVYKVRVGPEVNRDKATELARRIKTEQNLDGFVTTQE